ncbi:MAG TPA: alpha/beta hydrolase-fold protein [Allosphingosinicella sp.]|jgi:hypothetical protein
MRLWLFALALAAGSAAFAVPPVPPGAPPLSIGDTHRIVSAPLGEARVVNVVLPAGYAKAPDKHYPVLYLIDGGIEQDLLHVAGVLHLGAVWGRSGEAIVVGIETRDRRKELTGPTTDAELLKRYPTAGASAAFRAFIRDEVKPLIRASYRTSGRDAVIGESLAGLFILETYFDEPALFDAYAAIDPSLWWDGEKLSRAEAAKIDAPQQGRPVYLAMAREQAEKPAAMKRVTGAIRDAGSPWCLASRPDLLHSTIYQQLTPQALQFLLPPKAPPAPEFGFTVSCSESSSSRAN